MSVASAAPGGGGGPPMYDTVLTLFIDYADVEREGVREIEIEKDRKRERERERDYY